MASHDLNVMSRETTGKEEAGRMRRTGHVPAVAYGHKETPVKLAVNTKEFSDLLKHGGAHGLLTLKQQGGTDVPVVIKSIARHPATHAIYAIDFLRVSLNEKIHATVPIHLEGESDGVRIEGGVLVQALHELSVEAFPQDIPEHITVDISGLEFNGAPIHVREIVMPQGVIALTDGEEAVAVVNAPDVEPIVEETMTAEQIAEAEAADVNPEVNSEAGKEDKTTGNKSDTGEKPGKSD